MNPTARPRRRQPFMLISQACHTHVTALRFAVHRERVRERLRQSVDRYRLVLLDYLIGPDGLLLLCDPRSLPQLADFMRRLKATAAADLQRRAGRVGPVWKDRYAITLVQPAALRQCMLTLDLHLVATGRVPHPAVWSHAGWRELTGTRRRYRTFTPEAPMAALTDSGLLPQSNRMTAAHYTAITEQRLCQKRYGAIGQWTDALAVGTADWIEQVLTPIPDSFRRISVISPHDLPLPEPAPLTAATAGKRRRRDLVEAVMRCLKGPA